MDHTRRRNHPCGALLFTLLTMAAGCGVGKSGKFRATGPNPEAFFSTTTPAAADSDPRTGVSEAIGQIEPWEDPPPSSKEPNGEPEQSEVVFVDHVGYQCSYQKYDVTQNFDRALALNTANANIMPGMLLSGKGVQDGVFNLIPVARGPVELSIDVPIANPTRRVEEPNSSAIRDAVLSLIAEADESGLVRSDMVHSTKKVESFEDASMFFNVDMNYSGPLVDAGLKTSFSQNREMFEHYFALKHVESLFTITFADDSVRRESDFFAEDVTVGDLNALREDGWFGPGNPPVYVKSVTFGRIILATARVKEQKDSSRFEAMVEGHGASVGASSGIGKEYENMANSAEFNLLVRGGTQEEGLAALQGAKVHDMFGPAHASAAVPLYYEMRFAAGKRRVARTSDTSTFVEQTCSPTGKQPCEWACTAGATKVSDTRCDTPSTDSWTWTFEGKQGHNMRVNGNAVNPQEPQGTTSSRVCFSAKKSEGGMINDSHSALHVQCGPLNRVVLRWEANEGIAWCWDDVPQDAICDVNSPYDLWTPKTKTRGSVIIDMKVEHYSGAPRCYAEEWQ